MKQYSKVFFVVCTMLFVQASFAQSQMQIARIKQRLISELNISNVKADSVISVVQDFYTNARVVKNNTALKEDERKLALQSNRKEEMARLRSHLNNQQIKKLQQMVVEMKEERQNRKMARDSTSMQ